MLSRSVITYSAPSPAHRDFTALRLIRHAFAVRERLGDPRVVPGFRCPFFPGMPSSMAPGSSAIVMVQVSDADLAFAESEQFGTPANPAIRFTRGTYFGASRFACATACQVARPPSTDQTRSPQPQRAITSRLPAGRSPFLPLDITTTGPELLLLAGLPPARMAASLAAPDPGVQFFRYLRSSVILASAMQGKSIRQAPSVARHP
jgi:hypothetical protein